MPDQTVLREHVVNLFMEADTYSNLADHVDDEQETFILLRARATGLRAEAEYIRKYLRAHRIAELTAPPGGVTQ